MERQTLEVGRRVLIVVFIFCISRCLDISKTLAGWETLPYLGTSQC